MIYHTHVPIYIDIIDVGYAVVDLKSNPYSVTVMGFLKTIGIEKHVEFKVQADGKFTVDLSPGNFVQLYEEADAIYTISEKRGFDVFENSNPEVVISDL